MSLARAGLLQRTALIEFVEKETMTKSHLVAELMVHKGRARVQ